MRSHLCRLSLKGLRSRVSVKYIQVVGVKNKGFIIIWKKWTLKEWLR